jgi:beta-lactamase superfamily II metal-dependent hydrolase
MIHLPELIILDVGHGNCAILQDTNAVTVIDCPPPATLVNTLERLGIDTIDQILISHSDWDHAGGLSTLMGQITVRNIYINPDANNNSQSWVDIRTALELAEDRGTEVHTSLTSGSSKKIKSGQVEIEILAPSVGVALGGAGGPDLARRKQSSNTMSVVIGLIHGSSRVTLFPGDMSEHGLDNLLKKHPNIEAQILVFPHHGGSPGNSKGYDFAKKLCNLVKPNLVVFSLGRNHHFGPNHDENPRDDIIKGVVTANPSAHIMCTQLSGKCAVQEPFSDFSHLTNLPAKGVISNSCCGGTIQIRIDGKQTTYLPLLSSHRTFISNSDNVPTPMCLQHLIKVQP